MDDDSTYEKTVQALAPPERLRVMGEMARLLSRQRPVVIWIDNAQWALEGVLWAAHVLDARRRHGLPVLVLMTVCDVHLANQRLLSRQLEALAGAPGVESVGLEPLRDEVLRDLMAGLLLFDRSLADQIVERSAGNPMFVVQVVADSIRRGVFVAGEGGFSLGADASLALPGDVEDATSRVVASALKDSFEGFSGAAAEAVEVAAVLGLEVDCQEWRGACVLAGIDVPDGLLDALSACALITRTRFDHSFAFTSSLIRESLEKSARDKGRVGRWHEACVRMLERGYDSEHPGVLARVASHLIESGARERAIKPLLDAGRLATMNGEFIECERLLDRFDGLMEDLGRQEDDIDLAHGRIARARLLMERGLNHDAREVLETVSWAVDAYQDPELATRALHVRGWVEAREGKVEQALESMAQAIAYQHLHGAAGGMASRLQSYGMVLRLAGRLEEAKDALSEAIVLLRAAGRTKTLGSALLDLGYVYKAQNAFDQALHHIALSRDAYISVGHLHGIACSDNALGEVSRKLGALDDALDYYQAAHANFVRTGAAVAVIVQLNIGLVLVEASKGTEALAVFDAISEGVERTGMALPRAILYAGMLEAAALTQAWGRFGRDVERLEAMIAETPITHDDLYRSCTRAASSAEAAGRPEAGRVAVLARVTKG